MATEFKKSPLAPEKFPEMPIIDGAEPGTAATGLKYKGRDDLLLVRFPEGAAVAGVFTKSKTRSAPVDWCRSCLETEKPARALLVNAGNANAFTGRAGDEAMQKCIAAAAKISACDADQVYVSSTGVIGEVLPADRMLAHIEAAADHGADWEQAANAIRTTDTFAKGATRHAAIDGRACVLNGIVKGSGMIAPDMATMLGYIFTDADLPSPVLQQILSETTGPSFNSITVDSDTSTSDTVLAFATGKSGAGSEIFDADDPRLAEFRAVFQELMTELAHLVVKDGEGATKFIRISVEGAEDDRAAKVIALSIANSPLVKTAIAGEDANWGRIVMAVGKAGEAADRDKLIIEIGGQRLTEAGMAAQNYDEDACTAHLQGQDIDIFVDVGVAGPGRATVWTCDLTHAYIDINADYRS
ncbi:bifunctional glutamate N-acetyltransferase/amino-acid acetyltransferase ArgJ [Emcibacter nanhaiensis]|uniref:Arginine biosynthesis bifunctional protein ArgJ n=1 Tax=Emcibacter nanhaiensis TaxID=1505037 RepID=A0A501PNK6_9PROT|nr:bifunctional glutamate N-acetyltransferase/amino-acid acetyltransferase ArgJ [Emcibacter nanhaiensis]TPD61401.1 bifunctional glutamate N-acetyltransferase/amino-acid acetyltransferase ArgJ [Emcibacter nanhaiensis]